MVKPTDKFDTLEVKTIGLICSPFKDKFGTPRQSQIAQNTQSKIILNKKIASAEMLVGLQTGTYIWVLFWFHLNVQKKKISKVRPPRLRGETLGVLATRSPHRPNPIGMSLGQIVKIEKNEIFIEGLDLVDGTPVFDIKPFLPVFDQPKNLPESWIDEHPFPHLKVQYDKDVFRDFEADATKKIKLQLNEILSEDPRPLAYLNKTEHTYWLKYGDYDVRFEITDDKLLVKELRKLGKSNKPSKLKT